MVRGCRGASIFAGVMAETFDFEAFSGCEVEFLVTSSSPCRVGVLGKLRSLLSATGSASSWGKTLISLGLFICRAHLTELL